MFLRQSLLFKQPVMKQATSLTSPSLRNISKHLKAFATIDPSNLSPSDKGFNLVNGEWTSPSQHMNLIDPLNGGNMMKIPDTQMSEIAPFV